MSGGCLIVLIAGREALPVRAIPYVTGWQIGPYELVLSLGKIRSPFPFDHLDILSGLDAYHLTAAGPASIAPREWDGIAIRLKGLEATLREQRPAIPMTDDHAGEAAWHADSTRCIPGTAFVWLDEFLKHYTDDQARMAREDFAMEWTLSLEPMLAREVRSLVVDDLAALSLVQRPTMTRSKPAWIAHARQLGEEWIKYQRPCPSVDKIAQYLEGELSTQNVTGPRGKFLDWTTIKREALTGITGRKAGDRIKRGNPRPK